MSAEIKADTRYIGQSVPRANAKRLLQGRGVYTDDLRLPRLAHVVFFRSPHAHAHIKKLDFTRARAMPGVIAVVDGKTLAAYCKPWVAVLAHLKGIKSAPQHAIAIGRACWQGEAVAAGGARARPPAEDAGALVAADRHEPSGVGDNEAALRGAHVIPQETKGKICF